MKAKEQIHQRLPWVWMMLGAFVVTLASLRLVSAAETGTAKTATHAIAGIKADNLSFQNEIQNTIDRGLIWLKANQNSNGWWSTPDHPAVTALALMAFNGDPLKRYQGKADGSLQKGYDAILRNVKTDGSIFGTNLVTYNTSISMMGLLSANDARFNDAIRNARRFLVGIQTDFGEKGKVDSEFDGGFGYGTTNSSRSDLANTIQALEAIYYSKHLALDQPETKGLNWQAAIHFLQACQNLPGSNSETWVSGDSTNRGGFVYYPGRSMAGGETNSVSGRVALRSYGSMSYAGLLSFIYADLKKDDPRVTAVLEWLGKNYTVEENPGLGKAGLYYYYHLMAKALATAQIDRLPIREGKIATWSQDLALKLMELQARDGSWANDNVRWWEKDPVLDTAYSVLALEFASRALN